MSRMWLITCDRCGAEAQPAPSKEEANYNARHDGWKLGVRVHHHWDLCPECNADRPKARPVR